MIHTQGGNSSWSTHKMKLAHDIACMLMQINSVEYKQIVIFDHVTRRKLWKQFQPCSTVGILIKQTATTTLQYHSRASVMRFSQLATTNVKKELGKYENVRRQYIFDITGELLSNCVLQFCWRKDEYKNTTITCPFEDNSQFVWAHQKLWLMSSSTQWYNLLVPVWVNTMLTNFYMMILHEGDGWHVCGLVLTTTYMQGYHVLSVLFMKQGVCHTVALLFTLKKYLKAKEELWKFKYFTMQKYNLQKKKPPL